jgi:3-hydroxybutyryl-CoA dehydrogenase
MHIGVVGAGTIGIGVAQSLSEASHRVVLVDISEKALDSVAPEIRKSLRLQKLLNKTAAAPSAEEVLGRIERTTALDTLAPVDFVVENVTERWTTKSDLYHRLDALCGAGCIFAANTSCFSITRIASETKRPARVLGMHFMNPVPLKPAVEVIRGRETSEETLQAALALLATIGKRGIVVKDRPGFVSNRILMLTINEAIGTVHDGTATVEQVDEIFKMCFGHKMGPLETADLIGLDTILLSLEALHESLSDEKYRPSVLLCELVDANVLGRKTGKGFYDYDHLISN